MWSNHAESFNSWIENERHLSVIKLVDMIRIKLMDQMAERRDVVSIWKSVVCPCMGISRG